MGNKRILVLVLLLTFSLTGIYSLHFEYDENLSLASDVTLAMAMASPGMLVFASPASDYLAIGGSYGITMVGAYFGVRTPLKAIIDSERPYVGEETLRPLDTSEDYDSFPSGHALMAFTSAAYTQTITSLWYPDSQVMRAASIAAWSLATATAVLRVVSGNHYPTDVLAGAAIGSALGFLGPYLTNKLFPHDDSLQILAGPMVGMRVAF
ncbi:phosphatase PAP2 family protein [Sphaerochaeta sp.]|uniref:phosphatase PAP2 family protein n=2 Tax=Sphaerochaeta sp. TaxID=1972642 RepID=UPI003D09617F